MKRNEGVALQARTRCSKSDEANPGLVKNFNCYLFNVKGGLFTRLRLKENKFVICNLTGPQFCGKPYFSSKYIAI